MQYNTIQYPQIKTLQTTVSLSLSMSFPPYEMSDLHSYPPPLCPRTHHHRQDPEPHESDPVPVPVIDLQCLNDEDDEEMKKLEEACQEWGIFRLVNHGIPSTLMAEVEHLVKHLFSMSFESKQTSCDKSPVTYFWGTPALTPSGTALSGGPRKINLVEGFNVPLCQLSQFHPHLPLLQSFRGALGEYGEEVSRIARSLFGAMGKKLGVKMEKAGEYVSEKTGNVRVYRYPPRRSPHDNDNDNNNNKNEYCWGMEPHSDSSVLSILSHHTQDSGLHLLRHHQWLPVQSIPNTLIVNLGDMMQAISDDRYKSAFHRVKVNEEKERISVCYFVFPDDQFVIESSKYKPFTYSDFRAQVQHDIKLIGYKVGLSRFALPTLNS